MQRKHVLGQICIQITSAFVPILNPKDEERSQGTGTLSSYIGFLKETELQTILALLAKKFGQGRSAMSLNVRKRFEKCHRNVNYWLNSSLQIPKEFISWNLHALYKGCTKSLKRLRTIAFEVRTRQSY